MLHRTSVRIGGLAVLVLLLLMGGWALFWSQSDRPHEVPEQDFYRFPGLSGPNHVTVVPPKVPTSWNRYGQGIEQSSGDSADRSGLLLVALAHGLKSIGVPFRITRDVVGSPGSPDGLGLPDDLRKVLNPAELQALANFRRQVVR